MTAKSKNILSREFAATHWPGIVAGLFFLAGIPLFGKWDWLFFAPVFVFFFFKLKHEFWPVYLTAVLYALCFPHAGLGFLAFVCLAPALAFALDAETSKRAWLIGFAAGFFGNLGKVYWIVYPITFFSPIPFSVGVLVTSLICLALASFWGLHFMFTRWAVRRWRVPLWLVFACGWVFWDHWLTWFLTGFPWDVLGNAAYHIPYFNQTFDLFGSLSVGWLFAFGNAVAVQWWWSRRGRGAFPRHQLTALVVLVLAAFGYGVLRGEQIERVMKQGEAISVGFVQGNIDQNLKWKPEYREWILDNFSTLSKKVIDQGAELVIFPETSIPRRQKRWRPLHPEIKKYAVETARYVLAGVPSSGRRLNPNDPRGPITSLNSAVLVDPTGLDVMWYDKNRLVPFSEYIPYKHILEKVVGKIGGTLNFETGGYYSMMPFPKAPFSVFICYEAVYPEVVRRLNALGAKFLVTITNDAWFGPTAAPYQHWDQVAIRAIENRRWVARAANTGISGIIDPLGRTVQATDIYVEAAAVGTVYAMDTVSLYQRTGDLFPYVNVVLYVGLLLIMAARQLLARKEK